ncbi:MAG: hypothetical protein LBQ22_01910 [Bacteroidales bacterium]|jgi:hypothetical protein|nr:hypothetical protein [Bacteroidales bacterium]
MDLNVRNIVPQINGVVPSWANLLVTIGGQPVTGVTSIDYNDTQEVTDIKGLGNVTQGRGYGPIEYSGSITLLRDDIETIRENSETGRLQDLPPFDIIIQFIRPGDVKIITHKLIDCQFKGDGMTIKQGDTKNEQSIDLIIGKIDRKY